MAIKSPFVDGQSIPTYTDVIVFSKIVSSLDMSSMASSSPDKTDIEWARRMKDDPDEFDKQVTECFGCILDQSKWPIFWETNKPGRSNGAPWVLSVVCNLVKNGVDLETAWTMPEAQAVWMNAVFSISNGSDINIVSEQDKKAMEQLKALEDRMRNDPSLKPKNPRLKKASQN